MLETNAELNFHGRVEIISIFVGGAGLGTGFSSQEVNNMLLIQTMLKRIYFFILRVWCKLTIIQRDSK